MKKIYENYMKTVCNLLKRSNVGCIQRCVDRYSGKQWKGTSYTVGSAVFCKRQNDPEIFHRVMGWISFFLLLFQNVDKIASLLFSSCRPLYAYRVQIAHMFEELLSACTLASHIIAFMSATFLSVSTPDPQYSETVSLITTVPYSQHHRSAKDCRLL